MINITTQQQIEDFTRGCCFFGTGGGGDPVFGQKMLREVLDAGKKINIIDINDLKQDALTVAPYLIGPAPGPEIEVLQQEKIKYALTQEVILNMPTAAVKLLLKQQQVQLDAVVPMEMGAAATPSAVATAAWLDVPTVDGDYTGRAVPEITQMLPAINHFDLFPIASCDAFGNQVIIEKVINLQMAERLGRLIASASFGLIGQATLLMRLKQIKPVLVPHTLSKALAVGAALRQARAAGENSMQSIIDLTQAKVLFMGRVIKRQAGIKDGYYIGDIEIKGTDSFKNNQLKIWFKNENILSWLNDKPYIACPDLITMIDLSTFEPIINGKLDEGTAVIVFGLSAPEAFKTSAALKVLGPKHFGFDFKPETV